MSGHAIPPTPLEFRLKRYINIDATVGSFKKKFHEFPEAVLLGLARNQYSTLTTSGRAIPPTRLEYRPKMSMNIDSTVGSL